MAGNSFGKIFKITTFGESHGKGLGVIIDGCPSGLQLKNSDIQFELDRRKPGQSAITTQRNENEDFEIQSGVFEGTTTGTPISIYIANTDTKPKDYDHLENTYRPSHADMTYQEKYGLRDHRGGGRASARETAARVVAGAVAKVLLKTVGVQIHAGVTQVGSIVLDTPVLDLSWDTTEDNLVRCPDPKMAHQMISLIEEVKSQGDTVGGRISCVIQNCPTGLGEPVFDKLHADLAKAMLSINAVKGFEYGSGFDAISMKGSEHNDLWEKDGDNFKTRTNNSGGIQGGISNGMPIYFNVAFKPVSTLMTDQKSVNDQGEAIILEGKGRHDPCVVPRAVPIVEAMTALVLADHLLRRRSNKV